jgi:two-component system, OmpR family, sensor histidine kinase MtrB
LLSDLLEISRIDAGAAGLDLEEVDVRDIVASVCDGLSTLARESRTDVTIDAGDEKVTAVLDPRRVARILRNLVANAIEHGEGRPVQVRVGSCDEAVAVSVRDHGIGLDAEQVGLVFNRFWRADPARTRKSGGSGLGLAISLEDARIHGGDLAVWGARGQGSCFRLTLPRHPGADPGPSPLPLVPDDAPTQAVAAVQHTGTDAASTPNARVLP